MDISCIWEHNGGDTLLYAVELPGACARGESLEAALAKMEREARSYLLWRDGAAPDAVTVTVAQNLLRRCLPAPRGRCWRIPRA